MGITLARDPKDEPYLNLAAHSQADYLVSRDRDLLEADAIAKKMPTLRIVDPVAFLHRGPCAVWQRFLIHPGMDSPS